MNEGAALCLVLGADGVYRVYSLSDSLTCKYVEGVGWFDVLEPVGDEL
jgi:hypothetical protein